MKRILLPLLLPLMLLLALPAQAAEKPKDYIFKPLPDFEIRDQKRNFNKLEILSAKPESQKTEKTTYEGNLVVTNYNYKAPKATMPSSLQIIRHYQNSAKKLDGNILWVDERESETHASFTRNDKQYYMTVRAYTDNYVVKILEIETMADDTEILDADAILHKLDKAGYITLYINFDTGKATIKPESQAIIDEIAIALKSKKQLKVKLEGHTDNVGNADANKKLSDDRAKAVMAAIVAKGIDKGRLSAQGFGLEKPIADNNTEAGRAKNRRVELVKVQ
jgi:outer membrane protein OmpA-like peptidoglycan-associated protein